MPYALSDGARIHWEERGEGTTLLMVMGHGCTSALWGDGIDALTQHHRVITFDNRGTGKSSPIRKITAPEMASDAFAVLDAARVTCAHLYGQSMGGGIVLEMAHQRPERVRSLVLGATMAKTSILPAPPLIQRALLFLPRWMQIKTILALQARTPHPHGTRATADQAAQANRVWAAQLARPATIRAQARAMQDYCISEDEVRALGMPTLVIHGDEDPLVPYEEGLRLHNLIGQSELHTLRGAAHGYLVSAAEEANATVIDFLRRTDSSVQEVGHPTTNDRPSR